MKIELITTKQFIEQAEYYFRSYMDGLRRNAQMIFIILSTINII